jgi:hypothetical protein
MTGPTGFAAETYHPDDIESSVRCSGEPGGLQGVLSLSPPFGGKGLCGTSARKVTRRAGTCLASPCGLREPSVVESPMAGPAAVGPQRPSANHTVYPGLWAAPVWTMSPPISEERSRQDGSLRPSGADTRVHFRRVPVPHVAAGPDRRPPPACTFVAEAICCASAEHAARNRASLQITGDPQSPR